MIGYISLGTNHLNAAAEFYDALLLHVNAVRTYEAEDFIVWGNAPAGAQFSVHIPADGQTATVGNGVMIALQGGSVANVDTMHAKALALGGADEGAPGFRMEGFYAAYFRDLDGNKLNVHCFV